MFKRFPNANVKTNGTMSVATTSKSFLRFPAPLHRDISRRRVFAVKFTAESVKLTQSALQHLRNLRRDKAELEQKLLRIGVKKGGCSGLSYMLDFDEVANVKENDKIIDYEEFKLVTDEESLQYLEGMTLDYSNSLMNGGFKFQNPNACKSCNCGKSFNV